MSVPGGQPFVGSVVCRLSVVGAPGVRGSSPAPAKAGNSSRDVGLFMNLPKGVK